MLRLLSKFAPYMSASAAGLIAPTSPTQISGCIVALLNGGVNGTNWTDASGNGNTGVLTNGPTVDAYGAVSLDATDDYVLVAGSASVLALKNAGTAALWYRPSVDVRSYGAHIGLFDCAPGTSGSLRGLIKNPSILDVALGGYPSGPAWTIDSNWANTWHHIVMTWSALASPTVTLFVDNVQKASVLNSGYTTVVNQVEIGRYNAIGNAPAKKMTQFCMYNRVLTGTEIAQLYAMFTPT